jgi:hypothetical protein
MGHHTINPYITNFISLYSTSKKNFLYEKRNQQNTVHLKFYEGNLKVPKACQDHNYQFLSLGMVMSYSHPDSSRAYCQLN